MGGWVGASDLELRVAEGEANSLCHATLPAHGVWGNSRKYRIITILFFPCRKCRNRELVTALLCCVTVLLCLNGCCVLTCGNGPDHNMTAVLEVFVEQLQNTVSIIDSCMHQIIVVSPRNVNVVRL
jgi:hypothetical protein